MEKREFTPGIKAKNMWDAPRSCRIHFVGLNIKLHMIASWSDKKDCISLFHFLHSLFEPNYLYSYSTTFANSIISEIWPSQRTVVIGGCDTFDDPARCKGWSIKVIFYSIIDTICTTIKDRNWWLSYKHLLLFHFLLNSVQG